MSKNSNDSETDHLLRKPVLPKPSSPNVHVRRFVYVLATALVFTGGSLLYTLPSTDLKEVTELENVINYKTFESGPKEVIT